MKPEIVLIQPHTALTGAFVRLLPLGLLYIAAPLIKQGYPVHVYDCRIDACQWQQDLPKLINKQTKIVGISVMSGYSILESIAISRFVKSQWPHVTVVWGGPHPTFSPHDVLQERSIDFVISGYAVESFFSLVQWVEEKKDRALLQSIKGLSWRNAEGDLRTNDILDRFEFIDHRDIPYDLVDYKNYVFLDTLETVFPMYSAMGCPYQCIFCSSPARYKNIEKKWSPYTPKDVVDHIEYVVKKYAASFIYFIDDDSFVDTQHVEEIIDGIKAKGVSVKLGFRGVRVNEILGMSDSFLEKIAKAGSATIHVGIESGSDRILTLVKKGITREQILEANKRLARHPEITVFYNFIVGFPTETIEETLMTRDLVLELLRDNPACLIIPLNKPRPLPGTELYALAIKNGYIPPQTLTEWGSYDVESSSYNPVWLSKKHNQLIRMMFLCMYFIDRKIDKFPKKNIVLYIAIRGLSFVYMPIARWRFKTGYAWMLFEELLYKGLSKIVF